MIFSFAARKSSYRHASGPPIHHTRRVSTSSSHSLHVVTPPATPSSSNNNNSPSSSSSSSSLIIPPTEIVEREVKPKRAVKRSRKEAVPDNHKVSEEKRRNVCNEPMTIRSFGWV